jgi:hypothetical protein
MAICIQQMTVVAAWQLDIQSDDQASAILSVKAWILCDHKTQGVTMLALESCRDGCKGHVMYRSLGEH